MRTVFYLILWLIMLYIMLVIGIAIYVCTLSFTELLKLLYFLEYGDPDEEDHKCLNNFENKEEK